jgi:hypothetical protein
MITTIFDKTDKGREEIATRMHHLAPRLRTLLVLVDGKQSGDELLKKVAGIGVNVEGITELLNAGFIQESVPAAPVTPAAELPVLPATSAPSAEPAPTEETILPTGQSQYEAIYHFFTETIKSTIGLRGYGLQLKVEKALTVEEFRALRQPYLDAVLKARGSEMERSLRSRLDQLLYLGEAPPATTIIANNAVSSE